MLIEFLICMSVFAGMCTCLPMRAGATGDQKRVWDLPEQECIVGTWNQSLDCLGSYMHSEHMHTYTQVHTSIHKINNLKNSHKSKCLCFPSPLSSIILFCYWIYFPQMYIWTEHLLPADMSCWFQLRGRCTSVSLQSGKDKIAANWDNSFHPHSSFKPHSLL